MCIEGQICVTIEIGQLAGIVSGVGDRLKDFLTSMSILFDSYTHTSHSVSKCPVIHRNYIPQPLSLHFQFLLKTMLSASATNCCCCKQKKMKTN